MIMENIRYGVVNYLNVIIVYEWWMVMRFIVFGNAVS